LTRPAFDGRDKPFSDWLRKNPHLDSNRAKLDVSDIDFVFHKYMSNVDREGTREVKLMLDLEVKTWGKYPSRGQIETLFFRHQLLSQKCKLISNAINKKVTVWHFGQFLLIIHKGDRPDNSEYMQWGVFDVQGKMVWHRIDEKVLTNILGFVKRPDNFNKLTLRRHHITREFGYIHNTDRLFPVVRTVIVKT